ncbi:MAG: GspH/FimT family pseudopilin [Dokdonella sp.]
MLVGSQNTLSRSPRRGFGLIELMVTISIVAILLAVALPSFRTTINSNRASTQANDLIAAINLARNEAISRNRSVTVCAAVTTSGTPTACGSATQWNQGWMVFVDTLTSTAAPGAVAATSVLRTGLSDASIAVTSNTAFVRFSSRGEVLAASERTLSVKPASNCKPGQQRQVTVGLIGRVGTTRMTTCA